MHNNKKNKETNETKRRNNETAQQNDIKLHRYNKTNTIHFIHCRNKRFQSSKKMKNPSKKQNGICKQNHSNSRINKEKSN